MFKPDNIENEFFLKLGFSFSPTELDKGKVLISEPFLGDSNFSRTVILLVEYSLEEGAVGFVLNKPTQLFMGDIIDGLPKRAFPFHYGGPVDAENLFFVHTLGHVINGSELVKEGLFWGGDFEQVATLMKEGALSPSDIKFFGGYSGWASMQLERELSERSWILCDLDTASIMDPSSEHLWKRSLSSLGKKFSIMANFPEDPALN